MGGWAGSLHGAAGGASPLAPGWGQPAHGRGLPEPMGGRLWWGARNPLEWAARGAGAAHLCVRCAVCAGQREAAVQDVSRVRVRVRIEASC